MVVTVAGSAALLLNAPPQATSFSPTGSLVERFGLFVIIVLGEVVVGVVDGLSAAERGGRTIVVGMLALGIGFGFWWTYFDFIGERLSRNTARSLVGWLMGHLPLTLAIAAAGAGMVGLVEHAADARAPTGFAWLLSGSVATMLIACAALTTTLTDRDRMGDVYGPVVPGLLAAAAGALAIGWAHPTPWLFTLANIVLLAAVWWLGFVRYVARGVPAPKKAAAGADGDRS
jgi:low temperature requirement protein LtrA